jgi:hypothetical protein
VTISLAGAKSIKSEVSLNHLRIASPCSVSWGQMTGDDRVHFCDLCKLHVYNFAELTRSEAESLVANAEGRVCGRLYRRFDGTVITKDCPVGLRALRKRVTRTAGAVFATLMGFMGVVAGQKPADQSSAKQVTITRKAAKPSAASGTFSGTIQDQNEAIVAKASVTITNQKTKESYQTESSAEGRFLLAGIAAGTYDIVFKSPGFMNLEVKDVALGIYEAVNLDVVLDVGATMGIIIVTPLIDTSSPNHTITFKGEAIRRFPIQ